MEIRLIRRWILRVNHAFFVRTLLFLLFIGVIIFHLKFWNTINFEISRSSTVKLFSEQRPVSRRLRERAKNLVTENLQSIIHHSPFDMKNSQLELCPFESPFLVGWVNISLIASLAWKENEDEMTSKIVSTGLEVGGRYKPSGCQSRNKVAIIIPYRNRKNHLKIFLRYMHPFLQRQQLEYVLVVVEQSGDGLPFNRGMLMNIGFKETQLLEIYQCFIFHDVDLLPENDGHLYICPEEGKPRQMAFSIDIYDYIPTPFAHFGGVSAFLSKDFTKVNGFSNSFWGWGNEDDDLYRRVIHHNLSITRMFDNEPTLSHVTRYIMLYHRIADPNPDRMGVLRDGISRMDRDGLTNLHYQRIFIKLKPLYTHIFVEINRIE